jgi:hypothetical protein
VSSPQPSGGGWAPAPIRWGQGPTHPAAHPAVAVAPAGHTGRTPQSGQDSARRAAGAIPYNLRTPDEVVRYFDGLELVEPGVLPIQQWRPDPDAKPVDEVNTYGGIGRKK